MQLAPIIVFAYDCPNHVNQTLLPFWKNDLVKKSMLLVYCDGPKLDATQEQLKKTQAIWQVSR